jgi:DNA-binding PadR family transcriptional regulator
MLNFKTVIETLSKPRLVLSPNGDVRHVFLGLGKRRLGPLEKRILAELLTSPHQGADLARDLEAWPSSVYYALSRLEKKGLVKSTGLLGRNLEGTPIMRRFYTLNPDVVQLATRIPETSQNELKEAAAEAQTRGLLLEEFSQARMKIDSPNPMKAYEGRRQLTRLRQTIDEALREK